MQKKRRKKERKKKKKEEEGKKGKETLSVWSPLKTLASYSGRVCISNESNYKPAFISQNTY